MAIVLKNAVLADWDPLEVARGCLRIDGERIVERGEHVAQNVGDEVIDCAGAVVLPGLVNGHTHLYMTLAAGAPTPVEVPASFVEHLESRVWPVERALDARSIEISAQVGAVEALRCGTTTLFDHHASSGAIPDALDRVEAGLTAVGLRGVLCYETTDRDERGQRAQGLEENRRYLERRMQGRTGRFAGMVGAHASFTLEEETLRELAELAANFETGVHMHLAEDEHDGQDCEQRFQTFLMDHLAAAKLIAPRSIFAHGVHLAPEDVERMNFAGLTLAHCPGANMNNGTGTAPLAAYKCRVMLGTDGQGGDLFAEARLAWLAARQENVNLPPEAVLARLAQGARRASEALEITLGRLAPDAAADVVITDYRPATPLTRENLAAHFLFRMSSRHVRDVLVAGRWLLRDRAVASCNEDALRREAQATAGQLWKRMEAFQ
jgi:cytosine/adenosine deaminase-related metal-dependent hydrolase